MELSIGQKKENALLGRQEVTGTLAFSGTTPSQKQLADELAKKLNVKPDQVFVLHIYTSFGSPSGRFEAHVYESTEQLEKTVRLGKKAKEKLAKSKPAAAPEANPAEKKEEPKAHGPEPKAQSPEPKAEGEVKA
jgi:ribosomal protein S24E